MSKHILRQEPSSVLNLRKAKKVGKLSPKKVKGMKVPGRQPKNYKSPSN